MVLQRKNSQGRMGHMIKEIATCNKITESEQKRNGLLFEAKVIQSSLSLQTPLLKTVLLVSKIPKINSYNPYLSNTDTFTTRTHLSVPLLFVLRRFDCSKLLI